MHHRSSRPRRSALCDFTVAAIALTVLLAGCGGDGGGMQLFSARSTTGDAEPSGGYDVGPDYLRDALPFDPLQPPGNVFVSPAADRPYWWIAARVEDWSGGPNARVSSVRVNGREADNYYVIVSGRVHETPWITNEAHAARPIVVVIKMLWENDATYDVAVRIDNGRANAEYASKLAAPSFGGAPRGFRFGECFKLSETAGSDRNAEPVELNIAAPRNETFRLADELRLFRYNERTGESEAVPCQVFERMDFAGMPPVPEGMLPKGSGPFAMPSESVRLAFLADVPANESRIYVAAYAPTRDLPPPPPSPQRLRVTRGGDGGTIVENALYRVSLHPRSGQIDAFELKRGGVPRLANSTAGATHWNPDAYGDNDHWGHAFSWDPPDRSFVSANGPLLYRITRSGRLPGSNPEIQVAVTYSFWAGVPYVESSSWMQVDGKIGVLALRSGALVFDAALFDSFAWKQPGGAIRTIRARRNPDPLREATAVAPLETPWVALLHRARGYGVAAITRRAHAIAPLRGSATLYRPAYMLYTREFLSHELTYFVRTWVYPWGYNQNRPPITVAPGSTYIEEMAFLPFAFGAGGPFAEVEQADRRLRAPLAIEFGQ